MKISRLPLLRVLVSASNLRASSQKAASLILGLLLLLGAVVPVSAATISGTVAYSAYSGGQSGIISVTASSSPTGVPVVATTQLASPGAFTLINLPAPASYWLFAYRDSNANGTNDSPEARTSSTNAFVVSSDLSGVALTLIDPDSDGDGIPDWWELKYGLDPFDHAMDGDLIVPAGQTYFVDTVRSAVVGANPTGTNILRVATTNGFRPKDYVLVIAMQGPDSSFAGTHEMQRITALGSNYLVLKGPLTNTYTVASTEKIQVVKMPYFRSVTINGTLTCSEWDGNTGGIVTFHCRSNVVIDTNGAIDVSAKGYRGGDSVPSLPAGYGIAGEGTTGRPTGRAGGVSETSSGGGGASSQFASCGGGGGFGTSGEAGSSFQVAIGGSGAQSFGFADLRQLNLGGGGGGAGSGGVNLGGISGGAGGGIVFINCRQAQGAGKILSRGGAGGAYFTIQTALPNGSGAGAGGSISITAQFASSVQIQADGGAGGRRPITEFSGSALSTVGGGNGGAGRIRLNLVTGSANPSASPSPGLVVLVSSTNAVFDLILDTDNDGLNDLQEYLAGSDPTKADTDGDGLPDWWEVKYGLNPSNPADAMMIPAGDQLTNLRKFQLGLDPTKVDTDGDGIPDWWEVQYGLNPLSASDAALTPPGDAMTYLEKFQAGLNPTKVDNDGDGIPDWWELRYSLSPFDASDAPLKPQGDKLTYLQKFRFGLDPTKVDTDGDHLSDYDEIFIYGTNPLLADTDGDGIPDDWEVQYGLNPRVNDANESKSFDGVTNLQKYQWNLAHTNAWEQMYPNRAFSGTNTVSDYERFTGIRTSRPVYDRNDRLIGVDYSSGVSLAFGYDGNGNLIRQKWISRASETNGLPALFTFLNSLTNNTAANGPYGDTDGDGWTNLQEQKAGTNPNDPLSIPKGFIDAGSIIGAVTNGPAATNYIAATGDLDGLPGAEIVVGASGDFSGTTNRITVFTRNGPSWQPEQIEIGSWGVTSLLVNSITNRSGPAIYTGLSASGSNGLLVEYVKVGTSWQSNLLAVSQSPRLNVLGVTPAGGLVLNFTTNGVNGGAFLLTWSNPSNSILTAISTNASSASSQAAGIVPGFTPRGAAVRVLDSGVVEVTSGVTEIYKDTHLLPAGVVTNLDGSKLYFTTPSTMIWSAAQRFARGFGGDLVYIANGAENQYVLTNVAVIFVDYYWIGLNLANNIPGYPANFFDYRWISGQPNSYFNWAYNQPGGPQDPFLSPYAALVLTVTSSNGQHVDPPGAWASGFQGRDGDRGQFGVCQVLPPWQIYSNKWMFPAPSTNALSAPSAGLSSATWSTNDSGQFSVFFRTYVEDGNSSGILDKGDSVVIEEFILSTNSWQRGAVLRNPLSATSLSSQHGFTIITNLDASSPQIAIAEPDGTIRIWTKLAGGYTNGVLYKAGGDIRWQCLSGVPQASGELGLLGLQVSMTNQTVCQLRLWSPNPSLALFADATPQTAPSTAILPSPSTGGSLSQVAFRLWDNEGNSSLPMLEFQAPGSTTWSNATVVSVDSQTVGRVAALPTGSDHTLAWNAGRDLGAGFTNTVLLRARASDVTLTGDYSATVSYRVEVPAGNPVANPDSTNTLQTLSVDINVLANDTVQNGRTPSVLAYTQPANGTAALNGNQTIRYTPRTNFLGTDSFNYTLSDGAGGTNIAVVTVTVVAVNHPPTPQSYTLTTTEEAPVTLAWSNYYDADGDLVTLQSVRSPSSAGGTVTLSGGVITYTPATNFFGTDTFTFIVQDNGLTGGLPDPKQATNTVTVTVTPVNDAPTITLPTPVAIVQNTTLRFADSNTITVADVDAGTSAIQLQLAVTNGSLTFGITNGLAFVSSTNGATNLTVQATLTILNSALTNLAWQPASNFFGADVLRVVVNDLGNTGAGGALTANALLPLFVAQQAVIPPAIVVPPQGGTTVAGANVTMAVEASGTEPIAYQWKTNGVNIAGATGSVLTLANVQPGQAGNYQVVVTNVAGSITSSAVSLVVLVPPLITSAPDNKTVLVGSNVTLSAVASGIPAPSYQWEFNGIALGGAVGNSLSLPNAQVTNAGAYTVLISNSAGSVRSAPAVLVVLVPPGIVAGPTNQTVLDGSSAAFGVVASGTEPLAYQWQFNAVNLTGATNAVLIIGNAQTNQAGSYRVVVTNLAGSVTSSPAALAVLEPPVVVSQPQSATVNEGGTVTLTVTAAGTGPLSYQWQFNNVAIAGAASSSLTLNNLQGTNGGVYAVIVTNVAGSVRSAPAALSVNGRPVVTLDPQGRTVVAGSSVAFSVGVAGAAPFSYQWQSNGVNLAGATSGTLNLAGVTTNHAGSYQVVVTNVAGAVTSAPAALVVNRLSPGLVWTVPTPIVYGTALGAGQLNATNLASGTLGYSTNSGTILPAGNHPIQVTFTATDPSTFSNAIRSVSLTVAKAPLTIRADDKSREFGLANPPFTATYVGFVNGETNSVLTAQPALSTAANASSAPGNYQITASGAAAANYGISYVPGTLTVFANTPVITQQPTNSTPIAGSNVTFAVVATGTAPLTYQWRFSGTNLPGATNAALTLTNVQVASAGAYNVMVANPGGNVVSDPASLAVLVPSVITSQPQGQTVGAGSSVAFGVVVTGTAPFSYQWQLSSTNLPGATNSVLTITNVLTLNAGNYRLQVSNAAAAVMSDVASLTVLIPVTNSPPVLMVAGDQTVVEGSTLVVTNRATDTDLPSQVLTFSLAGAPSGATINPTNGVFTWTPTEFQGPSTNTITVLVADNGMPPMMAVTSFRVEVLELNTAPTLALSNTNVIEGTTLVLAGYASDVDWPPNTLTYSLLSVNPGGLTLNSTNGIITWAPTEAQGPGSYSITIRVADNGIPSLSATQTFTVSVTESNSPPVLGFIPNQNVYQGETVVIPVTAVDSDLPANELTFTLLSAPTNASFTNNTFVWRPTALQAGATYPVGIVVTDNGIPPLSATQTFQVTVNRLAQLSAQSLGANRVSISVSGRSNVIYTLEASTNLFFWETVLVTNSSAAVFEVIESTSPAGLRIYRIREQRQY